MPGTIYPELYFLFVRKSGFYHYRTLESLLFESTRELVRLKDSVVILHVIGVAAAAAIKFRPTFLAFLFGENVRCGEFRFHLMIKTAVMDIAHLFFGNTRKLVAGINVAVRCDGDIFVAAAAAAQSFYSARTLV